MEESVTYAHSPRLTANEWLVRKIEETSPLRTGRRKLSWGRDLRSRGRVHIGGTDRCTSVSATTWAPSWRLPWFSLTKHSAAFIHKTKQKAQVNVLHRESKHDRRAGAISWPPQNCTSRAHDNHTFPFQASSTAVTCALPRCSGLVVAPWWSGAASVMHSRTLPPPPKGWMVFLSQGGSVPRC